eukprot:m.53807 g.53807  ORF g.53807 m.53807 type:complete len:84 (-) comp11060_c0_seq2:542-793(-)
MEAIRGVCKNNKNLKLWYHPGVLLNKGIWSCCDQRELDKTKGCRPCAMMDRSPYPAVEEEVWENYVTNIERIFQVCAPICFPP